MVKNQQKSNVSGLIFQEKKKHLQIWWLVSWLLYLCIHPCIHVSATLFCYILWPKSQHNGPAQWDDDFLFSKKSAILCCCWGGRLISCFCLINLFLFVCLFVDLSNITGDCYWTSSFAQILELIPGQERATVM